MTPSPSTLADEIYKLLYKESTVDGARILHEDRWPIERLLSLFEKYGDDIIGKDEKESYFSNHLWHSNSDKVAKNKLRASQRLALKKLVGKEILEK